MIRKWSITIPQLSGKTRRNAYVYVPNEARKFPNRRYPVLYMFDGHNVFFDSDATYAGLSSYAGIVGIFFGSSHLSLSAVMVPKTEGGAK